MNPSNTKQINRFLSKIIQLYNQSNYVLLINIYRFNKRVINLTKKARTYSSKYYNFENYIILYHSTNITK